MSSFPFSAPYADIYSAPSINSNHLVEYYYLESDLPFNAQADLILASAGSFVSNANTHAGLGKYLSL